MCRKSCCSTFSYTLLSIVNVLTILASLGIIGLMVAMLVNVEIPVPALPSWMAYTVIGGAGFIFLLSLMGCCGAVRYKYIITKQIEANNSYEYDDESYNANADGDNINTSTGCTNVFFSVYIIFVVIGCIAALAGGVVALSSSVSIQTQYDSVNAFVTKAHSAQKNITAEALQDVDAYVYSLLTTNPTWWYDIQGVLDCCGYMDDSILNITLDASQQSCMTASEEVANSEGVATNADGCSSCKETGLKLPLCTSEENYSDNICQRISQGCPENTGKSCFSSSTTKVSCYKKIYEPLKEYANYIGYGMFGLWFLLTILSLSSISLMCIKCCVQ